MEYLDPEKKRKHRQRIAIGYVLIGLIIGAITLIVLLAGYGYGFDRKTGEFVQNGILFVDTKHEAAQVSLNGKPYGQTDLRLVLREGEYSLLATREGYREWRRDVDISGGELRKLTYGLLIPTTLQSEQQFTLEEQPTRAIQSIDKDRVVAWASGSEQTLFVIDLAQTPASIERLSLESLIESTLSTSETLEDVAVRDIEFIDFDSSDDRVLAYVTVNKKQYTWLINTESIEESINLTNTLPAAFRNEDFEITMIDRDATRYYLFDKTAGEVYQAELRGNALRFVTVPDIEGKVLAFTGYDDDWMLYVTESDGDTGLVDVMFRQNDQTIRLKQMKTSDEYFLALANNTGKPYIGISASQEIALFVYKDPVEYLKRNATAIIPSPAAIMPIQNLLDVTVSNDASIVMGYNKTNVVSYDFLSEESHYKELDHTLSSKDQLKWIDGQHYSYVVDGTAWVVDYDGSNQHQLTAATAVGIFYRDDSEGYFSFVPNDSQDEGAPQQSFVFTSLLTEADQ